MRKTLFLMLVLLTNPTLGQEKQFKLQAPPTLVETGFLQHLLPRFSLKTGIRIQLSEGDADASFAETGVPVFRQDETVWHLENAGGDFTDAFEDWLLSDVGKRTIESFASSAGGPTFSADVEVVAEAKDTPLTGDAALGEKISLVQCGRCHVVNETNRMNAIGSTPSFSLMRTFADWQERFETFFLLKPHPAFTQVEDVTEPFAEHLPSPIAPVMVSLEEIEAITAYVGSIAPADLGAPIQSGVLQSP